ncbi:hypothetical protein V8G54_005587, partial [Vigna mungo]
MHPILLPSQVASKERASAIPITTRTLTNRAPRIARRWNQPPCRTTRKKEERNLLSCETQTPTETRKAKPPPLPYKNPKPKPKNETKNNASLSLQPERHQKQEK